MKSENVKGYLVRGLSVIVGIFMVGIAVGFFKMVAMGADPFTAMNTGISSFMGMQFGTLQLIVNAFILVLVFFFKKQFIGFGTIINMVFVGYTADFLMWTLERWQITFDAWPIRIFVLAAAVLLICVGDALYISADMGMAPYDAAGYIVETLTRGKLPFNIARILLDILCVCIGFFTGMQNGIQWKIIGVGTVISAFCTGPLIQFFRVNWSDRLLEAFQKK
ncbi:MAG: hypothetical protein OSJ44_14010 [Lachnospiraceae bacterium]|nr:hypothetical protein [Lachnospiraceae bacterium]